MRRAYGLASLVATVTIGLGWPRAVDAVEWTEIASSFDEGDPFDLFLGVTYNYEARRAAIKRELSGAPNTDTVADAVPVVKDLIFKEDRHLITPYAKIGVFHDVQLGFALPIVVNQSRTYEFDQRADPCIFPGSSEPATCIDRTNSSTLLDRILPNGSVTGGTIGYDADDPDTGFALDSKTVFRSVDRSGLDQVHVSLAWAPMNQVRDDTKPTWVLQTEFRISVGKIMRFNRLDPGSESGVSRGVHEFRASTSVSKRTRWAEPFVYFWWQTPIGVRGGNDPENEDGSLFWDVGYGQVTTRTQSQAGTMFGFEAIVYDKAPSQERFALEFTGRIEAKFNGMGYSEMWEPIAFAGDVTRPAGTAPLVVDRVPTPGDDTTLSHPGVTVIENYMTFGGRVGLHAQLGPNVSFGASFEIGRDQTHAITYTDAGTELPGCDTGATPCEQMDDALVTPGTVEVDPLHQAIIDAAGRRYLVDETSVYTALVTGQFMF